jgi:hypothetical protein
VIVGCFIGVIGVIGVIVGCFIGVVGVIGVIGVI